MYLLSHAGSSIRADVYKRQDPAPHAVREVHNAGPEGRRGAHLQILLVHGHGRLAQPEGDLRVWQRRGQTVRRVIPRDAGAQSLQDQTHGEKQNVVLVEWGRRRRLALFAGDLDGCLLYTSRCV